LNRKRLDDRQDLILFFKRKGPDQNAIIPGIHRLPGFLAIDQRPKRLGLKIGFAQGAFQDVIARKKDVLPFFGIGDEPHGIIVMGQFIDL
jgi:hypothetical protein